MPATSYKVLVFHLDQQLYPLGLQESLFSSFLWKIFLLPLRTTPPHPPTPGVFPVILLLRLTQIRTIYYFNFCLAEPLNILLHYILTNFID